MELDAQTLGYLLNGIFGVLLILFAAHTKKLRQIKNLTISVIKAFDDHKTDAEETQDIINQIKVLVYRKK